MTPLHFGLPNRHLGLQNRHLGVQNRFLQPPESFFGYSWPPPSHFYGFGVDFGWILVVLGSEIEAFSWQKPMLWGSVPMHCQAQRSLVIYAENLGKTEVFAIIYSCQSSKSVQRYSTRCIILWKNNVFLRRRLRTLACVDFGVYLAPFGRVWASKLGPCWDRLGLHWTSSCDFWCLLGDLGALH